MTRRPRISTPALLGALLGGLLLLLLTLPLLSLGLSASPSAVLAGLRHPLFLPAFFLSLRTSALSLSVIVALGTPLASWLASSRSAWVGAAELCVDLPVVIPPATLGVALLATFGRHGIFGPALGAVGLALPFSEAAVVVAQVVVAAPFYVRAAANAFRQVEPDMLVVARSLGASPAGAFVRVALPVAAPGLVAGASLALARALGEFGATLLFAGNLPGRTQTMPLAILSALESDVRLAVVFSLVLAALGGVSLLTLRVLPRALRTRTTGLGPAPVEVR